MIAAAKRNGFWTCRVVLGIALCILYGISAVAAAELTDAECTAFARKIEQGIAKGHAAVLDNAFDLDALGEIVTAGFKGPESYRKGFMTGFKKSALGLGTRIAQEVKKGAQYKFMGLVKRGNEVRALFRLTAASGTNYQELCLKQGKQGVIVDDMLIYASGELFSETMRRIFLQGAQQQGLLDRLMGKENELIKGLPKMQAMSQYVQRGEGAKALAAYDQLPAGMKAWKILMVMRVQAASQVSQEKYEEAVLAFNKAFANDPSTCLIRIDGLFVAKKYDECLAVLDKFEKQVGSDAYVNTCRANACLAKGDAVKAKAWAAEAVEAEPDYMDAYWSLLTILLRTKAFGEAKDLMLKMERLKLCEFGDLKGAEEYAGFVASPQYQEWQKERAKRKDAGESKGNKPGAANERDVHPSSLIPHPSSFS